MCFCIVSTKEKTPSEHICCSQNHIPITSTSEPWEGGRDAFVRKTIPPRVGKPQAGNWEPKHCIGCRGSGPTSTPHLLPGGAPVTFRCRDKGEGTECMGRGGVREGARCNLWGGISSGARAPWVIITVATIYEYIMHAHLWAKSFLYS